LRWIKTVVRRLQAGVAGPTHGRPCKVTLPGPIPANNFRAFTVCDNQTRALLATDQRAWTATFPD
jgi:hypothetical protein